MARRKNNKKENQKRNIKLAAGALGLGAIGAGAYLLSRRKGGGNITIPKGGGGHSNTPNITPQPELDASPFSTPTQNQRNVWDDIGAKIAENRNQPRIDPPGKLVPVSPRSPEVDWDEVAAKINERRGITPPSPGLAQTPPQQKLLAPGSKLPSQTAIEGYYRADGTFVRGHERRIERVLREDASTLKTGVESVAEQGRQWRKKPESRIAEPIWSAESTKQIEEVIDQENERLRSMAQNVRDTYTEPVMLTGGSDITIDPSVSPKAAENMRDRYRNSAYHVDTVAQLERETKELNAKLRHQAAESIKADKESFKERLAQLRKEVKGAQTDVFNEPISSVGVKEDIASLQRELRDTLDDPFAPNYFETNKQKIKETEKKIGEKLAQVDEKLAQPGESLAKAQQLKAEVEGMKKRYKDKLDELYANSDEVKLLRSKIEQEKLLLEGLSEGEVTNEVWVKRKELAEQMRRMEQRKNFGDYKDVNADSLNNLISSAKKVENTAKHKIKNPSVELMAKREELLGLREQLKELPLTKRNLTRQERQILREFENLPKEYKETFGQVANEIKQLHELEKQFKADYDALSRKHDIYVGSIFSNNSVNDYISDVEKGVSHLEMRAGRIEKNIGIVEDLHNPDSYITRYKDYLNSVENNASGLATTGTAQDAILDHTMRRKKAIMQGGLIDGKEYKGVMEELGLRQDAAYMRSSLLNLYGERNIAKQMESVVNIEQELDNMMRNYAAQKGDILRRIQNEADNLAKDINYLTYRNEPSMRRLNEQVEKALNNYTSEFGETDLTSTFFRQKTLIEDAKAHLAEIGKIQPKYEIDKDGVIRLERLVRTDTSAKELNKEVMAHLDRRYHSALSKTKTNRQSMAKLYYDMNEYGLNLEGENSFFNHMRSKVLRDPQEAAYWNGLDANSKNMLISFSDAEMDKSFQGYYYSEALARVYRRPESFLADSAIMLPNDVSNKIGLKKSVVDRSMEYLTGREKANNIVGRKVKEVQETFRNLESMGVDGLKFSTYMTDANGNKIPYQYGLLGVQNMPKKLSGREHRFRNNMIDRLMRQMGINENGVPLVTNMGLVDKLSGVGVNSKEELKKLLGDIGDRYYGEASLNVLMQAERKNRELRRMYENNLYLYNFSEKKNNNVVTFGGN